jgi:hypothetical protein
MCFWYNSGLTIQALEQSQTTIPFFQVVFQASQQKLFTLDFELRRVIFGLSSIVTTAPQNLPPVVAQRLPDLTKWLAYLSMQVRDQRMEVLKDNEKYIQDELKKGSGAGGNQEEEFEDDDEEDMEDSEEEEREFQETVKQIQVLRQKQEKKNQAKLAGQVDDLEDEDDDAELDEGEESDYEYMGGDSANVQSVLDDVDELVFIRDQFGRI